MKTNFFKYFFLFMSMLAMNKNGSAKPINPFIDNLSPVQNAINVSKSSDIIIVFVENMTANTINNSTIKVFGLQTGLMPVTISYNDETKIATINPNNDYKMGEIISVSLTSGIQTTSATPITPFNFTFTVQAIGGRGTFTQISLIDSANHGSANNGVVIRSADIDQDGDMDLVTCGYFSGITVYKNNGAGLFTKIQMIDSLPDVYGYLSVYLGDYDNDGDLDIAFSVATFAYLVDNLYTYLNNSNGVFTYAYTAPGGGINGTTRDLDGDGDLDIATHWAFDQGYYFINNGDGIFESHLIYGLGYYHSNGIDLGDLNNDGNIDIAFSLKYYDSHSKIETLMNSGNATFTRIPSNTIYTSVYSSQPKLADFNGDHCLDITSESYHYFNNCSSVFSPTLFNEGSEAFPFDMDGDGDIDLAYTTAYSGGTNNLAKFLQNDGAGNFTNSFTIALYQEAASTATADFDNDGDIDIAICNLKGPDSVHSAISILLNDNSCAGPDCGILGPDVLTVNNKPTPYYGSTQSGYWEISNNTPCNASIAGSNTDDTVYVSSGLFPGTFILNFKAKDSCGVTLCSKVIVVAENPPAKFYLSQNYPNPFNSKTIIEYQLPISSPVTLIIYDINGRILNTLVEGTQAAGNYKVEFDGSIFPDGIYFYKIVSGDFIYSRKMLLVR